MDSAFRRIEKDKATSEAISVLVKKSILFQNLNEKDFSILVDAMA